MDFTQMQAEIEKADVIWVAVPLSRAEYHRLIPGHGVLTPDGVAWQELREGMGLQSKPYRYTSMKHFSIPGFRLPDTPKKEV